ncbi:MAG: PAS domain-containing protein [Candidatus Odinarchaeota archaeon]
MSKSKKNEDFSTELKNEVFTRLADNSQLGITIIRRGYVLYFNSQFTEIFGYTEQDIKKWKKFEYFKIIHSEDIPHLLQKIQIEDKQNAILQFRGVRKNRDIILVENYIYRIKYDNKYAYFSSYGQLEEVPEEIIIPTLVKTKEQRKIISDFNSNIINFLEENKINYKIIKLYSYREED